jgi:zinc transporter ZupT
MELVSVTMVTKVQIVAQRFAVPGSVITQMSVLRLQWLCALVWPLQSAPLLYFLKGNQLWYWFSITHMIPHSRLVKLASKLFLAGCLGIAGGVMLYVSFVEIFQKSVGAFTDAGR